MSVCRGSRKWLEQRQTDAIDHCGHCRFPDPLLNAGRSGGKPNTFALGLADQKPRVVWQEQPS
jgi:hypothetical protein